MADESLEVLSEVHLEITEPLDDDGTLLTRTSALPADVDGSSQPATDDDVEHDADGDLVVCRRAPFTAEKEYLIPHAMGTRIVDVGLQVWAGALLMGDFLVQQGPELLSEVVLELGAGTGLASLVAAAVMASHTHGAHAVAAGIPSGERFRRNGAAGIFSRERSKQNIAASEAFAAETAENGGKTVVFCTDIGQRVLGNCVRAIRANRSARDDLKYADVRVRELDWTCCPECLYTTVDTECAQTPSPESTVKDQQQQGHHSKRRKHKHLEPLDTVIPPESSHSDGAYAWSTADAVLFRERCAVFLAADVVYVDEWTAALADTVYKLLVTPGLTWAAERVLYLTIEKRINFSMVDLDVVAPAYEYFEKVILNSPRFHAVKMDTDAIPQAFRGYTRTPQLELWRITAVSTSRPQ